MDKNRHTAAPGSLRAKQEALKALTRVMAQRVELDVEPVFECSLRQSIRALGASMGCLHLVDQSQGVLNLVHAQGMPPRRLAHWRRLSLKGKTPPARVHNRGKPLELTGPAAPRRGEAVAAVPIVGAEVPLGTLTLIWADPPPPDPDRLDFLETVACMVALAIEHAGLISELIDRLEELRMIKEQEAQRSRELARLNRQLEEVNRRLEELSITDELTGLYNRRHFLERLRHEIDRSRRLGHPLCLIMADLDHFKRINDTLGHQVGDLALKRFARWLRGGVRRIDLVGRYGGEEFVVLLVDCALEQGAMVAEKLRRTVEERSAAPPFDSLGGFTVSMGLASLQEGMDATSLIAAADQALYRAKRQGRNQVVTAPDRK